MSKFVRFSEMRRDILYLFSWGRGPRGGEYYVPKGKPDIAKNRLYGKRADAAAKADGETKPAGGGQEPPANPTSATPEQATTESLPSESTTGTGTKQKGFQDLVKSFDGTGVFFPADETVKEVEVPTAIRKTSQTVLMLKGEDKYETEAVNGTLYAIPGVPDRPVFMTNIRGYYKVYDAKTGVQVTFAALKGSPAYKKQLQDRLLWTAVLSLKGDREKFDRSVDAIAEVIQRNGMPRRAAQTKPSGPTISMTSERQSVADIAKRVGGKFGPTPETYSFFLRSLEDPAIRQKLFEAEKEIPKRDWNGFALKAMNELSRRAKQIPPPKDTPSPTMLSGEPDQRMVEYQELVKRKHPKAMFLDPAKRMPSVEKVTKVATQKLSAITIHGPKTGTYDIYAIPGLPDVPFAVETKKNPRGGYNVIEPFTGYNAGEHSYLSEATVEDTLLRLGFMALRNVDAIRNGPLEKARKQFGS